MIKRFSALAVLLCLSVPASMGAAWAQMSEAQISAMKSNCRSDYMSNCRGVTPGGKEALMCLNSHMAKLSPGCQTAVKAALPPPPAAAAAPPPAAPPPARTVVAPPPPAAPPPAAAAERPPAAAPAPPAAKAKAVAPRPAPPPPRQAAIPPPPVETAPPPTPQQLSAIKVTCRGDFRRHCRGVPAGGAEAIACLQGNAARLSPDCKTSLADIADTQAAPAAGAVPVTQRPNAPIVMTAVIGRACLRDLALHCRNTGVGDGQKIACLMARGQKLAPLCKAALKITGPVR